MLPVGQFKDDQIQDHTHKILNTTTGDSEQISIGVSAGNTGGAGECLAMVSNSSYENRYSSNFVYKVGGYWNARSGNVTRGKKKGVIYIIKVL